MSKSGLFYRFVGRDSDFNHFVSNSLLQSDVAALLPNNDKTVTLKSAKNALIRKGRKNTQRVISTSSLPSEGEISSSTGSKYNSIASFMFFKASSRVSPSLIHPGREGTYAVNPPSSEVSRTILNFILNRSITELCKSVKLTDY